MRLSDLDHTYLRTAGACELIPATEELYELSLKLAHGKPSSYESVVKAAKQLGIVDS